MNLVFISVLGYIAVQLGIGILVSRRIHTEADYIVAGRSLGYGLATFTIFATWFGAETCIGAAGAIYSNGLSGGSADPFGYGVCILVMGLFFAVPLWKRQLTTLGDLYRERFSAGVEKVAVLLMIPGSLLWAAAQVRAFGQVLSSVSGFDVSSAIAFAALIVIVYTMFGGLLADAWTDLIQGTALMVGLVLLFVFLLRDTEPAAWQAIDPSRLQLFGGPDVPLIAVLEDWAIPICGSVIAAELAARVLAARSPQVARRSSLLAGGVYLLFGLIPVCIGLLGYTLLPDLAEPEQVLPLLARQYLPTFAYTLFTGALMSAILSTVDSVLLVASSLVSHNVIVPLRPQMTELQKIRTARVGVAVFGVVAYIMALYADGVYGLVEEASSFGSAGLFIVVVFGLFTRIGGPLSGMAALLAGVASWVAGAYLMELAYPYLFSLALAAIAFLVAATFERFTGKHGQILSP